MHLLAAQPGGFVDDEGIIDLQQTPADIVILTAADTQMAALANAYTSLHQQDVHIPSLRLANFLQLLKPAALDLYQDKVLEHAKVIVVSLLGGESYWSYGVEQLISLAKEKNIQLIFVPGDDDLDRDLMDKSNVAFEHVFQVWRYLREGGVENAKQLLKQLMLDVRRKTLDISDEKTSHISHLTSHIQPPQKIPNCLLHGTTLSEFKQTQLNQLKPTVIVLFYRSHLLAGNTAVFDALLATLKKQGLAPLAVALTSLKDQDALALVNELISQTDAQLILNCTGFASNTVAAPDLSAQPTEFVNPFDKKLTVLQLIFSSSTFDDWQSYSQGLRARDIAMQVVLPEMDGRLVTRALSFKNESFYHELTQCSVVQYQIEPERAGFVAKLAANFVNLAVKKNSEKRLAVILANYPTKDGRIGNGVGLDTPASTVNILDALAEQGYPIENIPEQGDASRGNESRGNALIEALMGSITNNPNSLHTRPCWQSMSLDDYWQCFSAMPSESQAAIMERWGHPDQDPKFREGRLMIAGMRLGETFVGIQPSRGFNVDLNANYHDPDLVPPHSYLAFYFWLREVYKIDALIHVGKHGNLEWLPGKGTALSNQCWPDIALGPVPNFYPFIVNDPGEGAQAKRRTHAVIIDHLMPPMSRAETYGDLSELEALVDECYQAMSMDERREKYLRGKIVDKLKQSNVLDELNLSTDMDKEASDDELLNQLDAYLCDIKEAQIRHGLHILGELPNEQKLSDTLVALLRLPRGIEPHAMGILHALAEDFCLSENSLDVRRETLDDKSKHVSHLTSNVSQTNDPTQWTTAPWTGNRPEVLANLTQDLWRTGFDARERLELYAAQLIENYVVGDAPLIELQHLDKTFAVLSYAKSAVYQALEQSVQNEINALMGGLNGEFVDPGPSGAPTRGRLDCLPTGRNFFSVDNRSIPSPAAWALGQKSAQSLIERHLQEHGDYPKQLGLSVWGTATMRTGGDDIAQAFALMGIKPIWAQGSQRVIDFEIVPAQLLRRPRVDVTLRVSGFFRDAFPNVMKLYDSAVLALADYEDMGGLNTIRSHIQEREQALLDQGLSADDAQRQASYRVFGSKPGAYGAGLQGLIDERCWEQDSDLAEAYLNWGGFAYGSLSDNTKNSGGYIEGVNARDAFSHQLSNLDAVVQNQDNREHDLLDSDDYYQFQGGMTNAVRNLKGEMPAVYHNDHSNPSQPKVRTLKEELNRVIRSRVLNPKWITAMQTHGYKGAFEMSASIDYLFAYDATTDLIDDYQYEQVSDALIFDEKNREFLEQNNPHALEEMAERMLEACQRGLWQEPNDYQSKLQDLLLDIDEGREGVS